MNVMKIRTGAVVTALIAALAISFVVPLSSQAGCLREWGQCGDCAKKAMLEAFRGFELHDMANAYVDAVDCDIDLIHCLMYAQHHEYTCSV